MKRMEGREALHMLVRRVDARVATPPGTITEATAIPCQRTARHARRRLPMDEALEALAHLPTCQGWREQQEAMDHANPYASSALVRPGNRGQNDPRGRARQTPRRAVASLACAVGNIPVACRSSMVGEGTVATTGHTRPSRPLTSARDPMNHATTPTPHACEPSPHRRAHRPEDYPRPSQDRPARGRGRAMTICCQKMR